MVAELLDDDLPGAFGEISEAEAAAYVGEDESAEFGHLDDGGDYGCFIERVDDLPGKGECGRFLGNGLARWRNRNRARSREGHGGHDHPCAHPADLHGSDPAPGGSRTHRPRL